MCRHLCKRKLRGRTGLVFVACKLIGCRQRLGGQCAPISSISKMVTERRRRCLRCVLMLSRQWQRSVCLPCAHSCLPMSVSRTQSTWQCWLKMALTTTDQCRPSRSLLCAPNELLVKRRMLLQLELQMYAAFMCAATLCIIADYQFISILYYYDNASSS